MCPVDPSTAPSARDGAAYACSDHGDWPVLICLFGQFRLLKAGQPAPVRGGGKTETLLRHLALRRGHTLPREVLLQSIWPDSEPDLAGQSLNSLVYSLHKLLGQVLRGAQPIVHADGTYRLNTEAGIGVDVACFDALADAGDRQARLGNEAGAAACYRRATHLYSGDLSAGADLHTVIERERLRARYLTGLAYLADHAYASGHYAACLDCALRLLVTDPCREDAHRLAMRCYVRLGERAQALRQYRVCTEVLRAEFGALPEPATAALFDQIRLDPGSV